MWSWEEHAADWCGNNVGSLRRAVDRAERSRSRKSGSRGWEVAGALDVERHVAMWLLLVHGGRLVMLCSRRSRRREHRVLKVNMWLLIVHWARCCLWSWSVHRWVVICHHVLGTRRKHRHWQAMWLWLVRVRGEVSVLSVLRARLWVVVEEW